MMHSNNPMPFPGAFNVAQHRDHGSAPRLSGAKSHIFRPPRTRPDSAANSMILSRSTASPSTPNSTTPSRPGGFGTRKRSRTEAESSLATDDWSSALVDSHEAAGAEVCPGSPRPLVNTKYVLAGGMDTPTMKAAQLALAGDNEYSDVGYRKTLGNDRVRSHKDLYSDMDNQGYFPSDGYGRDANGRRRGWNSPGGEGWSKAAIQVVGGVVGKVWEFCKTGSAVFRGFHAGGGRGYTMNQHEPALPYPVVENESFWELEKSTQGLADRESTPLPGRFPEEDLTPNFLDFTNHESNTPPAKRRQVSRNHTNDELTKNWVVVSPATNPSLTPSKPQTRSLSRFSQPTTSSANRRIAANTSRPASRTGFPASTATRRPPLPRASTVSVNRTGSPAMLSTRGASFASPRGSSPSSKIPRPSPRGNTLLRGPDSPAAREAKRWAAMKKKEDRVADESIRRLDVQLKAMIREGKEALGTKIEVEMEDDVDLSDGG
ncbi:hypothetical protein BJ875DRAFT_274434 [Amylocarpus encephaloides]|uniref:Uncharacterized protein n=1 Tax=Amylocarpus encephaloides TaxID=45428 RepID=A0A9P8C9J6_9HELO|nr:hypothetical protein BJ875DRAFT_274434 [Amylocarpus encephaloides]